MSSKQIFKNWKGLYAFVLGFLVVQLVVFYFISNLYR